MPEPAADGLIGMGWLYALHARSSIARGKAWQAEHMISVRDQALALACLRHGLPTAHGKGIDGLPPEALAGKDGTLVRSLELPELKRAFTAAVEFLAGELERSDAALAGRLGATLRDLAR